MKNILIFSFLSLSFFNIFGSALPEDFKKSNSWYTVCNEASSRIEAPIKEAESGWFMREYKLAWDNVIEAWFYRPDKSLSQIRLENPGASSADKIVYTIPSRHGVQITTLIATTSNTSQ